MAKASETPVTRQEVVESVQKIIDAEDKQKPLSDNKIRAILQEEGIDVSRRVVAKYRAQLGIPPANLRKN